MKIIIMMKRYVYTIFFLAILASVVSLRAQDQVTLRFTGQNQNGDYVALGSVVVENITQHWQEVLYYPDTILNIELTGIGEFAMPDGGVRLFQNVPNPFDGVTDFALQVPRTSQVQLEIYALNGKAMAAYQGPLDAGCHRFRAWLSAPQTYLLQARSDGGVVQIKLVNTGSGGQNRMEYIGKGNALTVENLKSDPRGNTTMPFNYGDTMSYTGYAQIANTPFTSAVVKKAQYASELIPLTFTLPLPTVTTDVATNILATEVQLNGTVMGHPDYPVTRRGFQLAANNQLAGAVEYEVGSGNGSFHYTVFNLQAFTHYYYRAYAQTALGITYGEMKSFVTVPPFNCGIDTLTDYDGNRYATVEIGTQCWMRENLRTTHFADGVEIPDGIDTTPSMYNPYRYIPNGDSINIPVLGYFYNWPAAMHGAASSNANPSGVQGICPFGWHLPSKAEFDQLVNYLESQPQYVCGEDNRNVAKALASTTGWQSSNNYCAVGTNPQTNNATGFTAFASGCYIDGQSSFEFSTGFWSATQIVLAGNYGAYHLLIHTHESQAIITGVLQRCGYPVRCLRD